MKLPIIYQTKYEHEGFVVVEIIIAFSLLILFVVSTMSLGVSIEKMKIISIKNLNQLASSTRIADSFIKNNFSTNFNLNNSKYGNETLVYDIFPFTLSHSDYEKAWGRNSCDQRIKYKNQYEYKNNLVNLGNGNPSTDIEVRGGFVYLTSDSTTASKHDLHIIDSRGDNTTLVSSINTGPGLQAIEVAGPYIFLAQASTVNQLQIVDIHDRKNPKLTYQLHLIGPTPTTTLPFARSIFYSKGYIYLGTEKWNGSEFSIIDVKNIYDPQIVGTFETNTLVNDIYVENNLAYLATSDQKQMRVLDVSNKAQPIQVDSFSPSGWQTQEGKILSLFENKLFLGRTVGGFNAVNNHEVFNFSSTSLSTYISKDIPGGVYGILDRYPNIFLLTNSLSQELQIFNHDFSQKILDYNLGVNAIKMSCDRSSLYFATGDDSGFSIFKIL